MEEKNWFPSDPVIMVNLAVKDVDEAIKFYRKLGFEATLVHPETGKATFATIKKGNIEIMFQEMEGFVADTPYFKGHKTGGTFTLYLVSKDIEELYKKLKNDPSVNIINELTVMHYGSKEFTILDPNNYVVVFGYKA